VAPPGTVTEILVLLQAVGVATMPLKLTELPAVRVPKLFPLIVTAVPTAPDNTERLVTLGDEPTLKVNCGEATDPPTVTAIFPVEAAPEGTGTTI
jgi:hypothetical protein